MADSFLKKNTVWFDQSFAAAAGYSVARRLYLFIIYDSAR
jgi:hypothetical protein